MNHKICIIQLGNESDLIHTFQSAKQLKEENKGLNLTLISKRDVGEDLNFLLKSVFDEIILFSTKDFFPEGTKNLDIPMNGVRRLIKEIRKDIFDLSVNLSHSESSYLLSNLIDAKNRMGPYKNTKNEIVITDKWSQLLYSYKSSGEIMPFHIVDIYRNLLGVKYNYSYELNVKKEGFVALYLNQESEKYRNIAIEAIIDKCQELNLSNVTIFKDEVNRNSKELEYKLTNAGFVVEIESTNDKAEIFNVLARANFVVSSQGYIANLSSIADTRSFVICENMLSLKNYGPYSSGTKSVSIMSENRLYTQVIDDNLLWVKSEENNSLNVQESLLLFSKMALFYFLTGKELTSAIPNIAAPAVQSFKILQDIFDNILEVYSHAIKNCSNMIESLEKERITSSQIKPYLAKVNDIDKLLTKTSRDFNLLPSLNDFFYINRLNSSGKDLLEITQNNLLSYYDAQQIMSGIVDLTNTALGPRIKGSNSNMDI